MLEIILYAIGFFIFTIFLQWLLYKVRRNHNQGNSAIWVYIVNKIIVFRNFNMGPAYLLKEGGAFFAARAISGVATWVLMVVMVKLGGDRGFVYEMFCKLTASVINMVANYVFSKLWIFKKK